MFTEQSLNFPEEWSSSAEVREVIKGMVGNLQASVSVGTWSGYTTACRNLERCSSALGVAMGLPLSETQVMLYAGYLLWIRKVKPETVEGYLSGLRMAHWAKGWRPPTLRTPLLNQLLSGAKNIRQLSGAEEGKPYRKAMTIPLMLLMRLRIAESGWSLHKKTMVWAIAVAAFFGSFRIGELLPKFVRHFDSLFTLLGKNVVFLKLPMEKGTWASVVRVHVKSPKVNRVGRGDDIEVFEMTDTRFCPIKALLKYVDSMEAGDLVDPGLPFFRKETGANYTKDNFNSDLKELLKHDLDYAVEGIWAHSFRAGISSHMARWGFGEDDIKGWGRWSSDAYKRYIKLPTLARRRLASQIQEKFVSSVEQLGRGK